MAQTGTRTPQQTISLLSAAAIDLYTVVVLSSDTTCSQVSSDNQDGVIGIAQNSASASGEEMLICVGGESFGITASGYTISRSQRLRVDSSGHVFEATTAGTSTYTAANDRRIGYSRTATATSGQYVVVDVNPKFDV